MVATDMCGKYPSQRSEYIGLYKNRFFTIIIIALFFLSFYVSLLASLLLPKQILSLFLPLLFIITIY